MNGNVILAFHARKDSQVLVLASKPASPFSTFFLLHPAHFLQAHSANTTLIWCRFEVRTRQFVRVVKETDSKSVGLCPRKFESCSCRFFAPLFFSFRFILLDRVSFHFSLPHHSSLDFTTPPHLTSHLQQTPRKRTITPHPPCPPRPSPPAAQSPFPRLPSRSPRSPSQSQRTSPSARATPSHHTALPESPWEAAPAREHSPSIPPRR